MDFQRNILFIGLLAVSYFLFISWQKDYAHTPSATEQSAVATGEKTAPAAITSSPTPQNSSSGGDLAGLTPASTPATGEVPVTTATKADAKTIENRVTVRTDVLELAIDLNGGDVVQLSLPKYPASLDTPGKPVQLMSTGATTYVAQSGLVATQGPAVDSNDERARYTADGTHFDLEGDKDTLEVVLHLPERNGVAIDKIFRFRRGDYLIDVSWHIRNNSAQPWSGWVFGQLKRDGSGDPGHSTGGLFSSSPTYLGGAYYTDQKTYNKTNFKEVQEKPLKLDDQHGGWIAFVQHYFVGAWIPAQDQLNKFSTRYRKEDNTYLFGFTSPQVTVAPGATGDVGAGLYAGPKLQDRLAKISKGLDLTVDYGFLWFIAQILFWLMIHIHALVGNWGVAIILLTVLVKAVFYYPSHVSYRSMANMRRITPELMRVREEYKNDRQKQAQEMMNLYRKEKVNPLGGCLPILVQMPVFLSLYWVLLESVELRQAPFFFWIHDLSVMDPYFILPVLMGISMFVQTKLNPAPPDPMQAKMMQWLPWVFTLFFLFFASGLVLYWLVNNILSISQQWFITRQIEKQHAKA